MGRAIVAILALWFMAAAPLGWKLYGTSTLGREELRSFYGDLTLLPNGHLQISTEDLTLEGLQVAEQNDPSLSRGTAKLAIGYRPPVAGLTPLSRRELLDAVEFEEIANTGVVTPRSQTVRELDCAGKRLRTVSVIEDSVEVAAANLNQSWQNIVPGSGNYNLLQLVCH